MIDVHTHLHPPKLARAIRKWFAENSSWKLTFSTEPQDVAQHLKENGVTRFLFCSYAHKPGIAREINEWLAQTSKELGRFGLPLATVHPADTDYVDYYKAALADGCIGLKIHEDVQKLQIDSPQFEPIMDVTEKSNGVILVHVGHIPWSDDTDNGPDRLKAVLSRHPDLTVIVAHMGVPDTVEYVALTEQFPNLFLDTTMVVNSASPMRRSVTPELMEKHQKNILFGSDFPNIPYAYKDDIAEINRFVPTDAARAAIFSKNAERLLARCGV